MQSLLEYLSSNESRFVEELCDYVRFPSVSAQEKHSKDLLHCAEWLRAHCRTIGLEAELEKTAGNPILVAKTPRRPGKRRPHFLVYGHYDVQPPDPLDLWKTPPFEPTVIGRRLYGRGASDNKGSEVADSPVHPADVLATLWHHLGLSPRTVIEDRVGRPHWISEGKIIEEILA